MLDSFVLNTCRAFRSRLLPFTTINRHPMVHDPRFIGVTVDNFIDNCHASNHAPTYCTTYIHTHRHIQMHMVRAFVLDSNRIAATASHRYHVPRERAPVAEIRVRVFVCWRERERERVGGQREETIMVKSDGERSRREREGKRESRRRKEPSAVCVQL